MPRGTPSSNKSSGERISHYGGITIRINGTGNLQMRLISLDDVVETVLLPLPMTTLTNIQPTRLSNFNQQRAFLELKTTEINEVFKINRIIVWTKPIATSFPQ